MSTNEALPELPPLPATKLRFAVQVDGTGKRLDYTASQMHTYAIDYARAALAAAAPSQKPFGHFVYIAAEQRGEFVHDLDEAIEDLTNCECEVTALYDHPAPAAPAGGAEPVADRELAPPNSLPDWDECSMRVANSNFIERRIAEGGYGPEHDTKLATQLHRFIHEYDDADPYRSAWFLHRLELLLNEVCCPAPTAQSQPVTEFMRAALNVEHSLLHDGPGDVVIALRERLLPVLAGVLEECGYLPDLQRAAQPQPPKGWKLVPEEITMAMDAATTACETAGEAWTAMLAAAPPSPTVLFDSRPQNQRIAEAEERMRNPAPLEFEDECAANMNGHWFGPHGPNGEQQCQWCGAQPTLLNGLTEQETAASASLAGISGARLRHDHDWRPRELQEKHGEVTLPLAEFKRLVAAQPERYCSALDPVMQVIKAQGRYVSPAGLCRVIDDDEGVLRLQFRTEDEASAFMNSLLPTVDIDSAPPLPESAQPEAPAEPSERVKQLLWNARTAMLDYGKARVDGSEDGVRSSTTAACDALEELAALATPAESVTVYLKDGETVAECLARNQADVVSALGLLADARRELAAIKAQGGSQ